MNKRKKWIVTTVILVVFCAVLGVYRHFGPGSSASVADPAAVSAPRKKSVLNVNGLVVRPQSLADGITMVGNLLPDEEVDLSFETSGKIVEINFKEGSIVRKGELLARSMTNRCWRSCRATKRSSSWPRTGFTARARCSKRTPSVRRPTSRPARSWRCSTPISTSSRPISR